MYSHLAWSVIGDNIIYYVCMLLVATDDFKLKRHLQWSHQWRTIINQVHIILVPHRTVLGVHVRIMSYIIITPCMVYMYTVYTHCCTHAYGQQWLWKYLLHESTMDWYYMYHHRMHIIHVCSAFSVSYNTRHTCSWSMGWSAKCAYSYVASSTVHHNTLE